MKSFFKYKCNDVVDQVPAGLLRHSKFMKTFRGQISKQLD